MQSAHTVNNTNTAVQSHSFVLVIFLFFYTIVRTDGSVDVINDVTALTRQTNLRSVNSRIAEDKPN